MSRIQRYVSKELAHFVGKGLERQNQFELLVDILKTGLLKHPPRFGDPPHIESTGNICLNLDGMVSTGDMYISEVVCFCDIPPEDFRIHIGKYSSLGLSFSKDFIVAKGGAPVFYVPRGARVEALLPSGNFERQAVSLSDLFDEMVREVNQTLIASMVASVGALGPDWLRFKAILDFLAFRVFSFVKTFDETLEDVTQRTSTWRESGEWSARSNSP